ncbi:MAG: FkbM family methyltransferase [Pseudohongiellaceae bacterium]
MNLRYQLYHFLWRQPWVNRHLGKSLYKRICAHGPAPDAPFTTDFFGLRYEGNLRNTIDFSIFYFGAFEKPLLFFLRDCLNCLDRSDTVFCDVGANIGQHSLFMSTVASRVHAFEPYDKVRNRLLHQIGINKLENLQVHPVGLSVRDEVLPFYAPTGRNEGIGSFDQDSVAKGNRSIGSLQLVNGDAYLAANDIHHIDLMKIDVEGFEKPVLQGLQKTLFDYRPIIICELTYAKALSFTSLTELQHCLPPDYSLFSFATRKPDGSKARRRGAKAKRSGEYRLLPYTAMPARGQDDIIAVPNELLACLQMQNVLRT